MGWPVHQHQTDGWPCWPCCGFRVVQPLTRRRPPPHHPALHRNIAALRALAKNWVPLLLNTFLATPAVQRGQVEEAISAYACVCDPATLATFFRAAITKLIKVGQGSLGG